MIRTIISWLMGGGLAALGEQFRQTYELKLRAETDEQRLAAEVELQRIEAIMHATSAASADRWSATSIGRYLIVLPFGLWWTAIFIDSIFDLEHDVLALPSSIQDLAFWLVPVIVAGDVGRYFIAKRG